jgi:Domain of unknown function (DUF4115)
VLLRRLGVGLLALVVLALLALNVLAWSGGLVHEDSESTQKTAPAETTPPPAKPTRETRPPATEPAAEPVARERPPKPARRPRTAGLTLSVTATRGDCWVEVRAGSATGEVLYAGTLANGSSLKFARPKLWLRLGAASNVDVVVNGEPSTVPPGTVELTLPDV